MNERNARFAALSPEKQALVRQRLVRQKAVPFNHSQSVVSPVMEQKPVLSAHGPQEVLLPKQVVPVKSSVGAAPLSFSQERVWFLEQRDAVTGAYNIPSGLRLKGRLNIGALHRALDEIVRRHEALRARFEMSGASPRQVIEPFSTIHLRIHDLSHAERAEELAWRACEEEAQAPFDLSSGVLLRALLVKLSDADHILLLTIHHIACDEWSISVLIKELNALYNQLVESKPPRLPELPMQYPAFALWQRQTMQGTGLSEHLAYWLGRLKGSPAALNLPLDRPRPPMQSYAGAHVCRLMPRSLALALADLGRLHRTTLFTILLSAFQALLHRYTADEDILVGTAITNRSGTEAESMIGTFINTLVLRGDLSGNPSFLALLERASESVVEAHKHADIPFERLVEALRPERSLSRSPLFQVMFILRNAPRQTPQFSGIEAVSFPVSNRRSKFDLTLYAKETKGGLVATLEYNTDLFDEATMLRMLGHYQTLLEAVVADPQRRISDLPLLTDFERRQMTVEWNPAKVAYPDEQCLHELIEEQGLRTPHAVAVSFEGAELTYAQLNAQANQLARQLQSLGVGPDCRVAICVERSQKMVVGLLAILKTGGAYVPLDPEYPKDRLAFMLEDSGASVLLTQEAFRGLFPACQAKVFLLDTDWPSLEGWRRENLESPVAAGNLAYLIYTSGSTGKPKGVELTHRSVVNFMHSMRKSPGMTAKDVILAITTICFDIAGLELWLPLTVGARVVVVSRAILKDGWKLAALLEQQRVTVMQATPTTWNLLLATGWKGRSSMRILCGGEAWPRGLAADLLPKCVSLWNMYGPTETTIWSAACRIVNPDEVLIGGIAANTQFYVVDARMKLVPVGVPGELLIGGDGLARGYRNRPELTHERFSPNPFGGPAGARVYRTGDTVRWRSDGRIEFLGRVDHQVKLRGFRLELAEIEAVLNQRSGVQSSVVIVREDNPGDKRLAAYLVTQEASLNISELREWLKTKLPEYMIPAAFVTLNAFPLTSNGKVDRKALPKPNSGSVAVSKEAIVQLTPTQQAVARIWAEVLGISNVGLTDNFFDLGGHSLLVLNVQSRVAAELNCLLPLLSFFQHPTVAELSARIASATPEVRLPTLTPLRAKAGFPNVVLFVGKGSMELCNLGESLKDEYASYAAFLALPEEVIAASTKRDCASLPSMEEMAKEQCELIRRSALKGPIILVGYCFQAMLAFETARQLLKSGVNVAGVVMLDVWMVRPPLLWRKKVWLMGHIRGALATNLGYFWHKFISRVRFEAGRAVEQRDLLRTGNFSGDVPWVIVERIYFSAMRRYKRQVLDCPGVLIKPRDDWWVGASRRWNPSLGAKPFFTGGLHVLEVPGKHLTILGRANAAELTRVAREALAFIRSGADKGPVPDAAATPVLARTVTETDLGITNCRFSSDSLKVDSLDTVRSVISVSSNGGAVVTEPLFPSLQFSAVPGPPLFLIPSHVGEATFPPTVVRKIGSLRLCQDGLEYPGLRGREAPCIKVEDIAKHLIHQIQRRCPQGPYGLCGYSFGGIMAYEVACQMRQMGLEVDVLILWDSLPRQSKALYRRPLRAALSELWRRFRRRDAAGRVHLIWQIFATKCFVGSMRLRRLSSLIVPETPRESVARAAAAAERFYQPLPYDGNAVMFRAQELGGIFNGASIIAGKGWESLVRGKLDVVVIPGSHLDIWLEPSLSILAQKTANWLGSYAEEPTDLPREPSIHAPLQAATQIG